MYTSWYDKHSTMLDMANELYGNVKRFTSRYCPDMQERDSRCDPAPSRYYEYSPHNKLFDMQETVFLFFFDN